MLLAEGCGPTPLGASRAEEGVVCSIAQERGGLETIFLAVVVLGEIGGRERGCRGSVKRERGCEGCEAARNARGREREEGREARDSSGARPRRGAGKQKTRRMHPARDGCVVCARQTTYAWRHRHLCLRLPQPRVRKSTVTCAQDYREKERESCIRKQCP